VEEAAEAEEVEEVGEAEEAEEDQLNPQQLNLRPPSKETGN
jgi:hypothetical protein